MAKTSPEKLAAALKANLKRRKAAKAFAAHEKPTETAPKPAKKPDFP